MLLTSLGYARIITYMREASLEKSRVKKKKVLEIRPLLFRRIEIGATLRFFISLLNFLPEILVDCLEETFLNFLSETLLNFLTETSLDF